jgi:16S rRNA (cytosine967-C5)-methyltransferase
MTDALPAAPDALAARRLAVEMITLVVDKRLPLDDQLEKLANNGMYVALSVSDRGLVKAIATAAMRRLGTIRHALNERLERGVPPRAGRLNSILIAGAAQILELRIPDHAAVNTCVTLAHEDKLASRYAPLVNAVLRRLAKDREQIFAISSQKQLDTPVWLRERWERAYGPDTSRAIVAAHLKEPTLDISVKGEAQKWADHLGATLLPTGSLRVTARTPVNLLPGFEDGAWWVQDAAAALPARLLKPGAGMRVLDLCAAPGGKTAQLAAAGADVTAVDRSAPRMARLEANMKRLGLIVETVVAEGTAYTTETPFDAVLLDAPCSATGTIRRHPDTAWSKTLEDIHKLSQLQLRLLDHATTLVRPGGTLIYATCSLEREEGENQIEAFLGRHKSFRRDPISVDEVGGIAELISPDGDLRCLPGHLPNTDARQAGLDGFFASRLVRDT